MESPDRPILIYALTDPDTGEVRYVGQTRNLWRRYAQHLLMRHGTSAKLAWLKDLEAKGALPGLVILETVPPGEADTRERHWIASWRSRGAALVNYRRRQGLVKKTYVVDTLYVDLIERYAKAEGVELKDVVNLAFHEFFERRDYLPEDRP